jgi:phosphate transport system ATP-binding protein
MHEFPRQGARPPRKRPLRGKQALQDVSLNILDRAVMALIGPSGCGKTTFLRCLIRMNDTIPLAHVTGEILIDGENINDRSVDLIYNSSARASGWCSKSQILSRNRSSKNVAYGPRIHGLAEPRRSLRASS